MRGKKEDLEDDRHEDDRQAPVSDGAIQTAQEDDEVLGDDGKPTEVDHLVQRVARRAKRFRVFGADVGEGSKRFAFAPGDIGAWVLHRRSKQGTFGDAFSAEPSRLLCFRDAVKPREVAVFSLRVVRCQGEREIGVADAGYLHVGSVGFVLALEFVLAAFHALRLVVVDADASTDLW